MDEKHIEKVLRNSHNFSPDRLAEFAVSLLPPRDMFQTFLLSLLSFLACISALATSFGPIPLTKQMEQAAYIYQGKIRNRWTEMEPESQRPYTYWNLDQVEVLKAPPNDAGSTVVLRAPGGEIGNMGYRVSGSAEFRDGEEVIVFARETRESSVKEIVGLASGKYSVESPNSKASEIQKTLRNGIGFTALDANGIAINVQAFKNILQRVKNNTTTTEDQKIIFNTQASAHRHEEHQFPPPESTANTEAKQQNTLVEQLSHTNEAQNINTSQNPNVDSDKSSSGLKEESALIYKILALASIAFFLGAYWILRKK